MELNITTSQRATSRVAVAQTDTEGIRSAGLTIISDIHVIPASATIGLTCAFDMASRQCVSKPVGCDTSTLDFEAAAVILESQMTPEPAILDPTCYSEGSALTTRSACDPPAACHEVPALTAGWFTLAHDISMGGRDHHVRNTVDDDMQGIDGNIRASRTVLLELPNQSG